MVSRDSSKFLVGLPVPSLIESTEGLVGYVGQESVGVSPFTGAPLISGMQAVAEQFLSSLKFAFKEPVVMNLDHWELLS